MFHGDETSTRCFPQLGNLTKPALRGVVSSPNVCPPVVRPSPVSRWIRYLRRANGQMHRTAWFGRRGKGHGRMGQPAQSCATAIRKATSCLRRCRRLFACTCCRRRRRLPRLRCRCLLSRLRAPSLSSSSATLHRRRRLHRLHLRKQLPRVTCISSKLCYPSHREAQDGCLDKMFDPHMETTPKFMLIVFFFFFFGDA
jgi:hypothetical protein